MSEFNTKIKQLEQEYDEHRQKMQAIKLELSRLRVEQELAQCVLKDAIPMKTILRDQKGNQFVLAEKQTLIKKARQIGYGIVILGGHPILENGEVSKCFEYFVTNSITVTDEVID